MNATLLIHAIVRQTTVLIAALATTAGQRAQLASVANLVFADLVCELREQGLANKVIADMFGMALRTYHRKVARLSMSRTVQGKSLWEAVLAHVRQHTPLLRSELLRRFAHDDEATLRSVVLDLVESGLVRLDRSGDDLYLEASDAVAAIDAVEQPRALESLVLVALHQSGRLALDGIAAIVPADLNALEAALAELVRNRLVTREERDGIAEYACDTYLIPFGDEAGWEAAVFDHYQAMVVALVTKLRSGTRRSDLGDAVGGSTFMFDLWRGHPLEAEIVGYLRAMRKQGMELRQRLEHENATTAMPAGSEPIRVTAYVGQSLIEGEQDEHG